MSYDDTRQARETVRAIEAEYATLKRSCRTPSRLMRQVWLLCELAAGLVRELERTRAAAALFGMPAGSSADVLRQVLPSGYELVRVHPAKETT